MSWVRIWVHLVFSTKNRKPFLNNPELRKKVFEHIKENGKSKDIWLDAVNGYDDHAHCLISLGKDQNISKIAQLIKGESSYWINKNKLTFNSFTWQDDYWATGVSENHFQKLRNYILNQEDHHKKLSFKDETDQIFKESSSELLENKRL